MAAEEVAFRERLREALTEARRSRDAVASVALRNALAALANEDEDREVVQAEADDLRAGADLYEAADRVEAAETAREQAAVLERFLG